VCSFPQFCFIFKQITFHTIAGRYNQNKLTYFVCYVGLRVNTSWRVLGLRMEETFSICGGVAVTILNKQSLTADKGWSSLGVGLGLTTPYHKNLTPWRGVLLDKLTVTQLVKFPALYGTRMFTTVFTRACCWSLS
jgi:hypothetical protein